MKECCKEPHWPHSKKSVVARGMWVKTEPHDWALQVTQERMIGRPAFALQETKTRSSTKQAVEAQAHP